MKVLNSILAVAVSAGTALIAYRVNVAQGSRCPFIWAVVDFFVWPLAWLKWLVLGQVNLSLIKQAFAFFLQ